MPSRLSVLAVCGLVFAIWIVTVLIVDRLPLTDAQRQQIEAEWNPAPKRQTRGLQDVPPNRTTTGQKTVSINIDSSAVALLVAFITLMTLVIALVTKFAVRPIMVAQSVEFAKQMQIQSEKFEHQLGLNNTKVDEALDKLETKFYRRAEQPEDYPASRRELKVVIDRVENLHRRTGNLEIKVVDLEVHKADRGEDRRRSPREGDINDT